ncbi:hypothetical protein ACEZDB_12200 [Streptacidiphilus sp. N1-3]|uniref:MmpS family membrane protein n=1 Tax=Streptacidiphilus alkalitolerans TaxID=3342712 RepID=A0ABV6WZD4_9ACTN
MSDTPTPPQPPEPPGWGAPPAGGQQETPTGAPWQKEPPAAHEGWQQPPPGAQGWPQQPGQPPYNYGPPVPPQKKRRFGKGCLFGCLGAVVAIVAIIVVLAVVLAGSSSKTDVPSVTNKAHPPADDVRITSCDVDSTTSLPTAKLLITNKSSKTSTYLVTVEFDKADGTRVSEGATGSTSVASGQKVETSAGGPDQVTGTITCKVTDVTRLAG